MANLLKIFINVYQNMNISINTSTHWTCSIFVQVSGLVECCYAKSLPPCCMATLLDKVIGQYYLPSLQSHLDDVCNLVLQVVFVI